MTFSQGDVISLNHHAVHNANKKNALEHYNKIKEMRDKANTQSLQELMKPINRETIIL